MDERLDLLPCGYFVLTNDWEFVEMNKTMRDILCLDNMPRHMHDVLTVPSKVYFQTYFVPSISVHHEIREMYLNFKVDKCPLPVLMNVTKRNGLYEGIVVQIKVRDEYENQLLKSKREAEKIQQQTDEAYNKLLGLLEEVESKQQQLLELNGELQELATRDELTGLYNRRVFRRSLDAAIERAELYTIRSFSLLLFDIDHFKTVNDTYGHQVGDDVLRELARKLEHKVYFPDIVARIGGEEFAILFDDPDHQKNCERAEELRCYIENSELGSISITVSMGITSFQKGDQSKYIYGRADDAQYTSKRNGRNRLTHI
ncbi:GGDEF domain-containing protein [Sporosarcina sp. P16a]|uniref:GGDEF domain-containing protein n=1 Tax=unclassified Sporosarcina TaxID=2647733 RepID=UPI000C17327A|nr:MULTISPECIES: diguanylate cyclase [unclassified Sporosarcina]PIC68281.1 GGDEF domain-containing protein [Sporosarcina sp. P16a]PIC94022.1 GGDEF domain-containing protein [Sporosarcina sp. P25]